MVEPLRRAEVPRRTGELDAAVGIEKLGPDNSDVVLLAGGVLKAREPTGAGLHVRVEDHHVPVRARRPKAAVDVCREAAVRRRLHHLDAGDLPQRLDVPRATGIV